MAQQPQQPSPQQQAQDALVVFEGFAGLNTQPSRYGIADKECAIMDGWFPAGKDNARTIPDNGPAVYTAPPGLSIAFFDFVNIGATPYALTFLSDGSVVSVVTSTGVAATIAAPGTIQNPGQGSVGVTQWGSSYGQIVSAQPNGYFIFSYGGWYGPGQNVPGTGAGVVPTGIYGTAIETYQSRVWIANGSSISYGAPGSVVDFTGASGGGSFTSNDPSLRIAYTQLKAANGYLYLFGDSSVSYLANPQTGGTPVITTFSLQNVDPEIGTAWPNTVDVIGSNLVFANAWGAQVSQGGRIVKISDQLDGIYNTVPNFGGLTPTAAKAIMFGRRVWVLLLPVVDQVTGQQTNKMFIWDTKSWCSASQSAAVTFIQHQEISSILTAWGTDGKSLYRLFQTPSTAVSKTIRSKFWAPYTYARVKGANRLWGLAQVFGAQSASLTVSVDSEHGASAVTVALAPSVATWTNNAGAPVAWTNNAGAPVAWGNGADAILVWPPEACAQNGALMGLTISTNAANVGLISVSVMPVDVGYRG